LKKIISGLGVLVVLAIGAALIVPQFVDWGVYRPEIARQLEAAAGRPVAIDGDVSVRLLPSPMLTAHGVRMWSGSGAGRRELARAGELEMSLALWPLVRGTLVGTAITLRQPEITVEIDKEGRSNWDRLVQRDTGGGAHQLVDLTIRDGVVRYRNQALQQTIDLRGLDATLDGHGGAMVGNGSFQLGTARATFQGSVTPRAEGGRVISVSAFEPESKARLAFRGVASVSEGGPRLAGKVKGEIASPLPLVSVIAPKLLPKGIKRGALGGGYTLEGDVTIAGSEISVDGLRLTADGLEARGSLDASFRATPRVRVAFTLNRLDLDHTLAQIEKEHLQPLLAKIAWPEGMAVSVDIGANALVYRGDIIRDVKAQGTFEDGRLDVRSLAAQLPGAADAVVSGAVTVSAEHPVFEGRIGINAGNIRGVLDWLGLDTSRVPTDRLRRVSGKGQLRVDGHSIALSDAVFDIDTSRVSGRWRFDLAGKPRVVAALDIDRIDLDAYLPRARPAPRAAPAPQAEGKPKSKTEAPAAAKETPPEPVWSGLIDAEFAINVGQLSYAGRTAKAARLVGAFEDGVLTLHEASVTDLGGISGKLSGTLGIATSEPSIDVTFEGLGPTPSAPLALLGIHGAAAFDRLGAVTARGRIAGTRALVQVNGLLNAAGASAEIEGKIVPDLAHLEYDLRVALTHANVTKLASTLGIEAVAKHAGAGALKITGTVKGNLANARISHLNAEIGKATLAGTLVVEIARVRPRIEGELTAGELSLAQLAALPAALAGASNGAFVDTGPNSWPIGNFNLDGLKTLDATLLLRPERVTGFGLAIDAPVIEAKLADGSLDVTRFSGQFYGGDIAVKLAVAAGTQPKWRAAVTVSGADLAKAAKGFKRPVFKSGTLSLDLAMSAKGASPLALLSTLNGSARVAIANGAATGFDLARINKRIAEETEGIGLINLLTEGMSSGDTAFARLSGSIRLTDGVGRVDDLKLDATGAEGTAVGRIDLVNRRIEGGSEFHFTSIPKAPPLTVSVTGWPGTLKSVFKFDALQRHLLASRTR
jgi:uncharacterized protein involved in outer membrane biogenesis